VHIKTYIKNYTSGNKIGFDKVIDEIREFTQELVRFNKQGMKEEFGDIMHFLQLWLYWKFGINGKLWKVTQSSVKKFMGRKKVWQKIYKEVGLNTNISNFCGNYHKMEKVIKQLSNFDISKQKAQKAYKKVVSKT
jgi:hypothetical protein